MGVSTLEPVLVSQTLGDAPGGVAVLLRQTRMRVQYLVYGGGVWTDFGSSGGLAPAVAQSSSVFEHLADGVLCRPNIREAYRTLMLNDDWHTLWAHDSVRT